MKWAVFVSAARAMMTLISPGPGMRTWSRGRTALFSWTPWVPSWMTLNDVAFFWMAPSEAIRRAPSGYFALTSTSGARNIMPDFCSSLNCASRVSSTWSADW